LREIPANPFPIQAGTLLKFTIPSGSTYGFALDNPSVGFVVAGVDGTRFHKVRRPSSNASTDMMGGSLMATDASATGGSPALFQLKPGTYQVCIYFHAVDKVTCRDEPERTRAWVHYPGPATLALSPIYAGP
jgi:hypothetical protein